MDPTERSTNLQSRGGVGGLERRRDLERNIAYFLGALGSTLGALGGGLSAAGLASLRRAPAAAAGPEWNPVALVLAIMGMAIAAWPMMNALVNRRPLLGGGVIAAVGLAYLALGGAAVLHTNWDLAGWTALAGGTALLLASDYATHAGGTEPLTWRALRSRSVLALEARVGAIAHVVIELVLVGALAATVVLAAGGSAVAVSVLALLGIGRGVAYLLSRRRR